VNLNMHMDAMIKSDPGSTQRWLMGELSRTANSNHPIRILLWNSRYVTR